MKSIRTGLLLWLILPLSLVASVVSINSFFSVREASNKLHDRTLQTVLLALTEHMVANENELVTENLLEVLTESLGDQFFYHFAAPGNAWIIGYSAVPERPTHVRLSNGLTVFYDSEYQGDPVRAVAARQLLSRPGLSGWTTLTVWQRVQQRRASALELFGQSLWRLALLVGMAGLVAWWAVSRGLRPLEDLRDAVAKRSPDDLSPIRRQVPVELRPITQTMNTLFERVSAAGSARERLIGDAAHQLRNPVAALLTQAQNVEAAPTLHAVRERASALVDSSRRLQRLVEQMLISARSNAGGIDTSGPVDIVALAAAVAREHGAQAIEMGQELSFEASVEHCKITAHGGLLREAFANLIDNAIRHGGRGASIVVGATPAEGSGAVRFSVSDTGEPLDDERLQQLSEAFHTGSGAAAGSGLGLSIVRDIVRLHGGRLSVEPVPDADGKSIVIDLPRRVQQ